MKRIIPHIAKLALTLLVLTGLVSTAVSDEHPLMETSVPEDMTDGPDVRLLTAVARELGVGIHFRRVPFKRRLVMMEHGELDLICGLLLRPERESYIHFIQPPYKTRSDTIFFVRMDDAGKITSYKDLKGLKIGVSRGSKYFRRFDQDLSLIKEPAEPTNNFNKLLLGRIDTVIKDESNGIFLIYHMGIAPRITMSPYRFTREKKVYFGISKKSWMMNAADQIQNVIKNLIESGQAKAIITEYYTSQGLPVPAM